MIYPHCLEENNEDFFCYQTVARTLNFIFTYRIRIIADNEGDPGRLPKPDAHGNPKIKPKDEHDIMLSSTYFIVRYDRVGNMVYLDTGHIASMTEDEKKKWLKRHFKVIKKEAGQAVFTIR